jgi:peroxiredoxin
MIEVGGKIPDYDLRFHDGSLQRLSDLAGSQAAVVLAFYVFDFSPT